MKSNYYKKNDPYYTQRTLHKIFFAALLVNVVFLFALLVLAIIERNQS